MRRRIESTARGSAVLARAGGNDAAEQRAFGAARAPATAATVATEPSATTSAATAAQPLVETIALRRLPWVADESALLPLTAPAPRSTRGSRISEQRRSGRTGRRRRTPRPPRVS